MAEDLARLAAEERAALLAGDLGALGALAVRKARAVAALEAGGAGAVPPAVAAALARNQTLIAAALEGVRDALRRRAAMAEARGRLSSYDASGARPAAPVPPSVERRA